MEDDSTASICKICNEETSLDNYCKWIAVKINTNQYVKYVLMNY